MTDLFSLDGRIWVYGNQFCQVLPQRRMQIRRWIFLKIDLAVDHWDVSLSKQVILQLDQTSYESC